MVDGKTDPGEVGGKLYHGPWFRPQGRICCFNERIRQDTTVVFRIIQQEDNNLIEETDDVQANYDLSHTFRRTAKGRAWAANLDSDLQNAMNRWRKIEQAKGKRPKFNMVDHYSHARDLMHVTWRYLFVQVEEETAWPSMLGKGPQLPTTSNFDVHSSMLN